MSAGRFQKAKYEADNGTVYNIRVQPESISATNGEPAGAVTGAVSAKARGSRRSLGIVARSVNLEWVAAPPAGYDDRGNLSVVIFTKSVFDGLNVGNTFTYLGANARIIGLSPESRR